MTNPKHPAPLAFLLERIGMTWEEAQKVTGLSSHSIRKACYNKDPHGWVALALEVDRLHRIGREVDRSYIALLEARIAELEEKLSRA